MFDMVRLWGNFPVITTVGGDITEDNVEEMYPTYFPPQNTAEEAYAQIEKDLTEAVENPNTPTNDTSDKSILTKSVARAMLAKVYAEKPLRDYAKVIKYADELAADGFDLVEDFSDLWAYDTEKKDCRVRNTKEAILEAHFPPGSGNWCTWMFGRNLSNWDESFTWAKWITLPVTLSASMKSKETRNVTMNLLYGMTADGATIIRQTIMPSCTNAALRSTALSICDMPISCSSKPKQKLWERLPT